LKEKYKQIYLDYNATTPCSSEVVDAMHPFFCSDFGNASSSNHPFGWMAMDAIDEATHSIAKNLGVSAMEMIYTSGATESINTILKGLFKNSTAKRNELITSKTEHKAVLDVCKYLENEGVKVTYLDVNADGLIDMTGFKNILSEKTLLTTIMYANNETGVLQPIEEISKLCRNFGSLLFSDATQILGKIKLNGILDLVDFACFSGHKVYGPKGIGLTFCKEDYLQHISSFILGGGQQRALRGGTYNTPAIIGLSKAIEIANDNLESEMKRQSELRKKLEDGLTKIEESFVNGENVERLPNTLNISFKYVDGELLLRALSKHLAVSNGSACNAASVKNHWLFQASVLV